MSTPRHLYLLDAFALIYRGYFPFVTRPRINSQGEDTSAIVGFLNSFEEILRRAEGQYIAVVFDPKGGTFRHEMYPEYKAQREKQPEPITFGLPVIKSLIEAMGVRMYEVPGYEADDVIGTIAHQMCGMHDDLHVSMVTPDKDYGQLVTDRIHMLVPTKGGAEDMGPQEVTAKYSLGSPSQVIDYLALIGDKSDNVPGIAGIGPVTAGSLLTKYESIDEIYVHLDELKSDKQRRALSDGREQLMLSRTLVRIITDVPGEYHLEDMKRREMDVATLAEIYQRYEFRSRWQKLLETHGPASSTSEARGGSEVRPSLFDTIDGEGQSHPVATGSSTPEPHPIEPNSSTRSIRDTPHTYHCVVDTAEMAELADRLSAAKAFALDTETDGLDSMRHNIVGLSFAIDPHEAWYVSLSPLRTEAQAQMELFRPALENPKILKIGHNIKFDLKFIRRYQIIPSAPYYDTILGDSLLRPDQRHNMDAVALQTLGYQTIPIEDLIGKKGKKQLRMCDLAPEVIAPYAAEDADITLQIYHDQQQKLTEPRLRSLLYDVEIPLMQVLMEMEIEGVRLDSRRLEEALKDLNERLQQIEQEIREVVHHNDFNINSPREVGVLLYEELELSDKPKKTKTGQYSTNEEELEKIAHKHPVIPLILQYRGLRKLISTYIEPLPGLINPYTGRIHTHYNQAVTSTGRLSSNEPNLQNIPVRDDDGKEIRRAFTGHHPEEGDLFLSADYSQIELRLMAHLSGDEAMIHAFESGADIHAATAAHIYHTDISEVTSDQRRKAKTANFGIIYGISAFGLSSRLGIPRSEASELIKGYFDSFPRVKGYMSDIVALAQEHGYVETLLGRRSYLPNIHSGNSVLRGYAERFAINAPIQGSAAEIIKLAMLRIAQRITEQQLSSRMLLQVHDELCFTVPKDEVEIMRALVREEMEGIFPELRVPLLVEVGIGANWLEAH